MTNTQRQGSEDDRFVDYFGTIQSIVTSSGNNDSGMFETNLRDERLLPFEGAGAESTWKLELPATSGNSTTAPSPTSSCISGTRPGRAAPNYGVRPRNTSKNSWREANASGLALVFSLQHDFPGEWHRFVTDPTAQNFTATVKRDHFPYFTLDMGIALTDVQLYAKNDKLEFDTPQELDLSVLTDKLNN